MVVMTLIVICLLDQMCLPKLAHLPLYVHWLALLFTVLRKLASHLYLILAHLPICMTPRRVE